MSDIIAKTMDKVHFVAEPNYETYVETDDVARRIAKELLITNNYK
jgi:1-deoxy-D-xylulose-5-phosphate reductoisomerase